MYASNYLENGILNVLRGVSFTAPAAVYLALFLSDPGEDGSSGMEISYSGYARMPINFSVPAAASGGGMSIKNIEQITFAAPGGAAGTITWVAILDSLTGGNMLWRCSIEDDPPVTAANEPPVFMAGDVELILTGQLGNAYKTKVLNIFRGTSIAGITPYHSLWNGSPDNSGAELSGDNYARVQLTFGAPAEQASGQLLIVNSAPASYNRPTANWGMWTHSALYDAASSGSPVYIVERPESKLVKKNYMPNIAVGAIQVGIN